MSQNSKTPKELTTPEDRDRARYIRDHQWETLKKAALHNPLYICWWDKAGRHKGHKLPEDLLVTSLIDSNQLLDWLKNHPDWTEIGEWSEERYAAPVYLTDQGREALLNREKYDMEPVRGGLVDPGWICIPAKPNPNQPPKPNRVP